MSALQVGAKCPGSIVPFMVSLPSRGDSVGCHWHWYLLGRARDATEYSTVCNTNPALNWELGSPSVSCSQVEPPSLSVPAWASPLPGDWITKSIKQSGSYILQWDKLLIISGKIFFKFNTVIGMVLKYSSYNQPCKNFWANKMAPWIKLSAAQAWVQSLEPRSRHRREPTPQSCSLICTCVL